MDKNFARLVSTVFNPITVLIVMPFFLVYKVSSNFLSAFWWMLYTSIFLIAIGGFIFYGVRKKIFSNFDVSDRRDRPLLFVVCGIVSTTYLIGLGFLHGPPILLITIIFMFIAIGIFSVINMWIKASIHVATISAFLFALAMLYEGYFILFLIGIPLVAWSRVKTRRHTISEVAIGGVVGSLLSLIMYIILKLFVYK